MQMPNKRFFEEGDVVTWDSFREGTPNAQYIEMVKDHYGAGPFVVRYGVPDKNTWRYTIAALPKNGGQLLRKLHTTNGLEDVPGKQAAFFPQKALRKRINALL